MTSVLTYDEWEEGKKEIWYKVEEQYKDFLCAERGDAFLIAILPYALSHSRESENMIIESEAPISERLYYQLTSHYIPTLVRCVSWFQNIKIVCELDHSTLESKNAVGTGISGGIDSYYTLLKSLEDDSQNYKVTHGLYCETAYGGDFDNELQSKQRVMAEQICKKSGIEFVDIQSNICTDLYEMIHEVVVTNIFLSFVYALEKLFSVYYFSSSHVYEAFEFTDYSSEYYALFNMYCLSSENLELYVTGADAIRHEKTAYIAEFSLPKKYMMVCRNPSIVDGELKNCSKCSKCTRTMIDLDLAGKLDDFGKIFDVDSYYSNKDYYWGYLFFKGKKDAFIKETLELMKEKKVHIPLSARIAGIKKIIMNKGKRGNPLQTSYRP